MDDGELNAALGRPGRGRARLPPRLPPDSVYTFKHALVRDAAANSLLRSEFRRINAGIVAAFEALAARPLRN